MLLEDRGHVRLRHVISEGAIAENDGALSGRILSAAPIGDTEGVRKIYEAQGAADRELATIPLGAFGATHDIAEAALYLCSDAGNYITGTDLVVDGGRSRRHVRTADATPAA